jgi:hypothetical protein
MNTGNKPSGSSTLPKYVATAGVTLLLLTPLTASADHNRQDVVGALAGAAAVYVLIDTLDDDTGHYRGHRKHWSHHRHHGYHDHRWHHALHKRHHGKRHGYRHHGYYGGPHRYNHPPVRREQHGRYYR